MIHITATRGLVTIRRTFASGWQAFAFMCQCMIEGYDRIVIWDNAYQYVTKLESFWFTSYDVLLLSLSPLKVIETYRNNASEWTC